MLERTFKLQNKEDSNSDSLTLVKISEVTGYSFHSRVDGQCSLNLIFPINRHNSKVTPRLFLSFLKTTSGPVLQGPYNKRGPPSVSLLLTRLDLHVPFLSPFLLMFRCSTKIDLNDGSTIRSIYDDL